MVTLKTKPIDVALSASLTARFSPAFSWLIADADAEARALAASLREGRDTLAEWGFDVDAGLSEVMDAHPVGFASYLRAVCLAEALCVGLANDDPAPSREVWARVFLNHTAVTNLMLAIYGPLSPVTEGNA